MKSLKKYVYIGLPVLGVLFYICYLNKAAIDMVYSDYIRLINSYLPDVWNPEKFFVPDLLTRMPVSYLGRAINVTFFDYSVTFDRMLSVLSFGVSALMIGIYCRDRKIGPGWFTVIMVFMFSLNKWEMLYNSTGWCHFMAFACFFYHYLVLDRVYANKGKAGDVIRLAALPPLVTILVAGPYCAIYSMTLFIAYGFIWLRNCVIAKRAEAETRESEKPETEKTKSKTVKEPGWMDRVTDYLFGGERCKLTGKQILLLAFSVLWPLLAFIWSDAQAVYEHSGAVQDASLIGTFFQQPEFFLKFLLKSFASIVFGVEFIARKLPEMTDMALYLTGAGVLASYFLALWMNFHYKIYRKTIFPLMFLAGGGMNHLVVMVSRWIFLKDTYGMSSRYALQYQVGVIGILLTFALVCKIRSGAKKPSVAVRGLAVMITAVFLAGNLATTADELEMAKYRKEHNEGVKERLLDFESYTEDELKPYLEYSKPGKKDALRILRENGWNIFSESDQ